MHTMTHTPLVRPPQTERKMSPRAALAIIVAGVALLTFSVTTIALAGSEEPSIPLCPDTTSGACSVGYQLAEDDAMIVQDDHDPGIPDTRDVDESLEAAGYSSVSLCARLWDHAQWWSGYAHAMFEAYKITGEPALLNLAQHGVSRSNEMIQMREGLGCAD